MNEKKKLYIVLGIVLSIDLHHNYLTTIEILSTLEKLTQINVGHNELEMIHDNVLITNSQLKDLNAEYNKLNKITPLIESLPLIKLNLCYNVISIFPDPICNCRNLTYLNFGHNKIEEIPPTISSLRYLKELIICSNNISILPNLQNCPLTLLNLADNNFSIFPKNILNCPLIKLYCDNNNISEIHSDISKLTNLKEMTLGNNILNELPKSLIHCKSLNMLDIQNNNLNEFYDSNPTIPQIFEYLTNLDENEMKQNEMNMENLNKNEQMKKMKEEKTKENRLKKTMEYKKMNNTFNKSRTYEPSCFIFSKYSH